MLNFFYSVITSIFDVLIRKKSSKNTCVMTANNNKKSGNGIGVGAALGVAFGSVYGNKYGNLSQSIALGLAIGVAIGAIFDGFIKKK
jgi:uncharacterized membrane protein